MITSKHLFIGIVLLGISIFCTAQEVKIEFSYDKPNNSLTLILTNNTDKEILVMNQGRLSEFSGSYIVLTESSNGKSADLTICLFSRPLKSTHLRDIARKQCPADFFNK